MLIPDNIHPERTIYYNGAFVLKAIQKQRITDILDLYLATKAEHEITMPVLLLCLDWLFLLGLITIDETGKVQLCS
jgi:hypothetical protein